MKKLFRRTASPEAARLLPASRLVPVPAAPRRVARRLALAIVGFLIFAGVSPWRQNVSGDGSVVAFTPDERPQAIEATISGRIVRWHVVEGQRVQRACDVMGNAEAHEARRAQASCVGGGWCLTDHE